MSQNLKCVIFGDRDVIKSDCEILPTIKRLINFLIRKNIQPIVLSNDLERERELLEQDLQRECPKLAWYIADRDGTPKKPRSASVQWVLESFNLEPHEAIYIGNSDIDMQTAVNSDLLFLNASWYGKKTNYGFEFQQPDEVARFVDIFCLRDNLWAYAINHEGLEYYALGIYGILEEKYDYSHDARKAAKFGRGHPDFWINYLLSTVYFSGLHQNIDYIATYPGHKQESTPTVMEKTIVTFAKCFRKKYLKDLIIRHTTAQKSASSRKEGRQLDHLNQLNTIRLNKYPLKGDGGERYKTSLLKAGKTVLVIDDFCTQGYSLEAARVYIEQTGAEVILLSFLKTIIKNYKRISEIEYFSPCQANTFSSSEYRTHQYSFGNYIIGESAHQEIRSKLDEYKNWQW